VVIKDRRGSEVARAHDEGCGTVPEWEERIYTPAVFVRVANKGLRAYGTWKSIRNFVWRGWMGGWGV
jgi:hypothetical protein